MLANIRMVFVANRVVADPEVSRLLPRLAVLQSHSHEEEQMQAIFEAYLKSWSSFNSIPAEVDRLFTSTNGDALIDATLSIYRTCQDFFSNSCL